MARPGKPAGANKGNPMDEGEFNRNPPPAGDVAESEAGGEAYGSFEAKTEEEIRSGPMAAIVEAAVTPEFEVLEEIGREGLDAAGTVAVTLAERFHEFANVSADCAKELLDSGYAFADEIRQARSPAAAAGLQIDFARSVYVHLLDHFVRLSEFYWNALRHARSSAKKESAKASC